MYHCHKNLAGESKNGRILPLHFFMQYKGREKKKKKIQPNSQSSPNPLSHYEKDTVKLPL